MAVSSLSAIVPYVVSKNVDAISGITGNTIRVSDYSGDLSQAVANAASGDTVLIDQDATVSSSVVVNKPLTIASDTGNIITVGLVANLNAISIQSNDVSIKNVRFKSTWNIGNDTVVRALAVSPSVKSLLIEGSTFENLRQPAYIDSGVSGAIRNNYTSNTKGWVVARHTNITFSGNTWGSNVLDIAFIPDNPAQQSLYSDADVVKMSDDNNDAVVELQLDNEKLLSDAYVVPEGNGTGNSGDDGGKWNPYVNKIQTALSRIVKGGTVHLADGSYTGTVDIKKDGTKLVGTTNSRDTVKIYPSPTSGQAGIFANGINNVVIKNLGVYGDYLTSGAAIKLYNGSKAKIENVVVKNSATTGINVNSYEDVTVTGIYVSNVQKDGISVVAKQCGSVTPSYISKNITLSNSAISNAQWSSIALYTTSDSCGSNVVSENLAGITIQNVRTQYGSRGVFVEGAKGKTITSPNSSKLVLQNVTVGQNTDSYIVDASVNDVDARSLVVNVGGGVEVPVAHMNQTQLNAVKSKVVDKVNNNPVDAPLGYVYLANLLAPILDNATVYVNASQPYSYATWDKDRESVGVDHYEYREYRNIAEANADDNGSTNSYWIQKPTSKFQTVGRSWVSNVTLYYRVVAVDAAGNRSVPSQLGTIVIDKTAPTGTITYSPNSSKLTRKKVVATLTTEPGVVMVSDGWTETSTGSGVFKKEFAANSNASVNHEEIAEFKDQAGNTGSASVKIDWQDSEKPTVSITDVAIDNTTKKLTFKVSAEDKGIAGLSVVGANIYDANNKGSVKPIGRLLSASNGQSSANELVTVDISELESGTYTIRAAARDAVNETDNVFDAYRFTVDNTAPTLTIDSVPASTNQRPTISGTVTDGSGVAGVQVSIDDGINWFDVNIDKNGNWTWTPSTALAATTYTVLARATDGANNTTAAKYYVSTDITVMAGEDGINQNQDTLQLNLRPTATAPLVAFTPLGTAAGNQVANAPVTPVTTEDEAVQGVTDTKTTNASDNDEAVLGDTDEKTWSLVNAVIAVAMAIAGIATLVGIFRKKDGDKQVTVRVLSAVLAAAAVLVFFVVEHIPSSMIWVNNWTLLFAVLAVAQIIAISRTKKENE